MVFAGEALFIAELCLLVYCVLSIITTPEAEVRHLPKLVWLLLVVVLPLVGGIAWLVTGRTAGPTRSLPYKGNAGASYDRPARPAATSPDDDEAFLASLRARAAAQRAEAERGRRERAAREEAAGEQDERSEGWRRRHGGEQPDQG